MIDNSNINQKIAIRQKGLSLLKSSQFDVLDMYAGVGIITNTFWAKVAKNVYCCEKENGKFISNAENVILFEGDNSEKIHISEHFEVIDLDAYGLVLKKIKDISKIKQTKERLIFFTEFNPIAYKKNWQYDFMLELLKLNPTGIFIEKASNSAVLYGYIYFSYYA